MQQSELPVVADSESGITPEEPMPEVSMTVEASAVPGAAGMVDIGLAQDEEESELAADSENVKSSLLTDSAGI